MGTRIDGTLGVIFPDNTTQSTAAISAGVNQTWQNVLASRTSGAANTNSSGKPITVMLGAQAVYGSPTVTVVVAGVTIANFTFPYGSGNPITFIVPPDNTYTVTWPAGTTMNSWCELR